MKKYGKRILSMLCALVMVLSMAAMIVPMHAHAEYVGSSTAAEFDALLSKVDPVHYHLYSAADAANSFSNTGAGVVDDADAVGGKAVLHNYDKVDGVDVSTGTNLYSGYGFDMNHTASGLHLGKISANVINNDGNYHVYRSTIEIPANMSAGGGIVYLFGTWQVQPKNMGDHLYNWRGQTVDLYISLKVVGEKTAAMCYIDRVVLMEGCEKYANATGEFCTQCGNQLQANAVPQNGIIADLNTTNFRYPYGDPVVDDAGAHTGKAAFYSYARRAETGDAGLMNAMIRAGAQTLDLRMQIEGVSDESVGDLPIKRLNANSRGGEYVLYKFTNKLLVPAKGEAAHKFYMFDCWGFQVDLAGYVDQLVGKNVDVYLSLKVTGDVSDRVTNTPAYYIDRIIIAEHIHDNAVGQLDDANHIISCSCGYTQTAAHTWTVAVNAWPTFDAAGERTCTCTVCNYSKTETVPALTETNEDLAELAAAGHTMVRYQTEVIGADAGSSAIVSDIDAFGAGNAAMIKEKVNIANGMGYYGYSGANGDILLDTIEADEILINEGYHMYKLSVSVTDKLADCVGTYFHIDGWRLFMGEGGVQVKNYVNKQLDIYISMKVTGTLTSADVYVDRIVFVDSCKNYDADSNNICDTCGKSLIEEVVQTGVKLTFTAADFSRPYGDPVVADESSAYGTAAKYSYADRYAAGNKDLYNAMIRNGEQTLELRTKGGVLIGSISVSNLQIAGAVSQYVTYKFSNIVLDTSDMYMFDCWGFQLPASKFVDQVGDKVVNVYLTMKITGDVTNTKDNSPTYYIESIKIVEAAYDTEVHEHTYTDLMDINDDVHGKLCTTCGYLDATGHDYGEGEVLVAPSYEAEGKTLYTCPTCNGTKIETVAKLASPTSGWNLTLDGNIAMNLHLNVTAEQIDTASVDVTVNGVPANIALNTLPTDENGLPVLTVELAAAQMMDDVTVVLHVAEQEDITRSYTVREYADYIMNNSDDENLINLVKHMLSYGAASQDAFDHNADNPANANVDITAAEVPTTGGEIGTEGSVSGLTFYGASLVHQNKIAVRFYFSGSLEGIDFGDLTVQPKGDLYYVEFADIVPQNLDQDITVTVSDGTNKLVVTYAPMDYIIRMYNKADSTEETKALVQALYGYYVAANAYVAE